MGGGEADGGIVLMAPNVAATIVFTADDEVLGPSVCPHAGASTSMPSKGIAMYVRMSEGIFKTKAEVYCVRTARHAIPRSELGRAERTVRLL